MYYFIITNNDELEKFAKKLKTIKDHQQYLDFKPVVGIKVIYIMFFK